MMSLVMTMHLTMAIVIAAIAVIVITLYITGKLRIISRPKTTHVASANTSRMRLQESKPVGVAPVATGVQSRVEDVSQKISELKKVLENVLTAIGEIGEKMERLSRDISQALQVKQQEVQPLFTQVGYTPSDLGEFRDLLNASYVALYKGEELVDSRGEGGIDEEFIREVSKRFDLAVLNLGDVWLYVIRHGDYALIASCKALYDSTSIQVLKALFKRFVEDVIVSRPS